MLCVWKMGATHIITSKGFVGTVCDFTETEVLAKFEDFEDRKIHVPLHKIEGAWYDPNWRNWEFVPEGDIERITHSYNHFKSVIAMNMEWYRLYIQARDTPLRRRKTWGYKRDTLGYCIALKACEDALDKLNGSTVVHFDEGGQLAFC